MRLHIGKAFNSLKLTDYREQEEKKVFCDQKRGADKVPHSDHCSTCNSRATHFVLTTSGRNQTLS